MKIKILEEAGFNCAMHGLAKSFDRKPEDMPKVALGLANKDKGHNKFLESMVVWMDIDAPRYWWQEFDTYRVGMTKQSEATLHTLKNRPLLQEDFEDNILPSYLNYLNSCIDGNAPIDFIKNALPEGFLQCRTVCTNYKVIRNIMVQRANHKLKEWHCFCDAMTNLKHFEYLGLK